ncbi:MAG: hypothetical protein L6U99_01145 [Clostridium sp.]|nr:MAG: hypothetical protein L6U99_01145 [Clostridium sp.]
MYAVIKKYNEANKHLVRIKGVATLCIMVTGLVYAFLLADYSKKSNYTVQKSISSLYNSF